jgi:hypothetical protein
MGDSNKRLEELRAKKEQAKVMKYFTAKRPSDGKACSEHNIGVGLLKEWIND